MLGGVLLTLGSLLIGRSISSSDAWGVVVCHNGAATVVTWRGFPFDITESPVDPFQDCDVIDCYPYYHGDAAVADACIWMFISYAVIAFVAVGIMEGERMDNDDIDSEAIHDKVDKV